MRSSNARPLMDAEHDKFKDDPKYVLECLYLELTEQIIDYMHRSGVSQAELARRMRVSQAYISKVFRETSNLTLMTLAKVAAALGVDVEAELVPREAARRPARKGPLEGWMERESKRAQHFNLLRDAVPERWAVPTLESVDEVEESAIAA